MAPAKSKGTSPWGLLIQPGLWGRGTLEVWPQWSRQDSVWATDLVDLAVPPPWPSAPRSLHRDGHRLNTRTTQGGRKGGEAKKRVKQASECAPKPRLYPASGRIEKDAGRLRLRSNGRNFLKLYQEHFSLWMDFLTSVSHRTWRLLTSQRLCEGS